MLSSVRPAWEKAVTPIARGLLRIGLTANAVTIIGGVLSIAVAVLFFPRGWFWQGLLALIPVVIADGVDGTMARISGTSSRFGAALDATMDRLVDGAILGSLALYFVLQQNFWAVALAMTALVFAQVTSYAKARGEAEGFTVEGGLLERGDRNVILFVAVLLAGFAVEWALPVAFAILSIGGAITVWQRMMQIFRQARESDE